MLGSLLAAHVATATGHSAHADPGRLGRWGEGLIIRYLGVPVGANMWEASIVVALGARVGVMRSALLDRVWTEEE